MRQKNTPVTSFYIWKHSFEKMKESFASCFLVVLLTFILPCFLVFLVFSIQSAPIVQEIQDTVNSFLNQNLSTNYQDLIGSSSLFLLSSLIAFFALAFITIACFFSIVQISLGLKKPRELNEFYQLYLNSLRLSFSKGIIFFLAITVLSLEVVFWGPLRIFSLSALMAFVITTLEKRGAFSSLWKALFFKYVSKKQAQTFSTIIIIISTSALIYLYEGIVNILGQNILMLDEWLKVSRNIWIKQVPFFPFSYIYLFNYLFQIFSYSLLLIFLSHFCSSLFLAVRKRLSEKF